MLASLLLIVGLSQDMATPTPFLWLIEGMGDPKKPIVVTISLTPFGLGNGIEVETISLDPLPTPDDPKPGVIRPLKTEPAPEMSQQRGRGLRAWFTPPGRRFHVLVTLSNGSTHKIDIYQAAPVSDPKRRPLQLIAPIRGTWATHGCGADPHGTMGPRGGSNSTSMPPTIPAKTLYNQAVSAPNTTPHAP